MNRHALLLAALASLPVLAGPPEQPKPLTNEPPYVTVGIPPQASSEKFVYGEQSVAGGRPILLTPDQANGVITRFKDAYPKLGNPRFVLYVNRDLVDENSGLKATARTEKTEITDKGEKTVAESSYKATGKLAFTVEDKQTVRDVERLFGRPLRMAGANLVDQRIASQMADISAKELKGASEQARRDREALSKVADVAIEVTERKV